MKHTCVFCRQFWFSSEGHRAGREEEVRLENTCFNSSKKEALERTEIVIWIKFEYKAHILPIKFSWISKKMVMWIWLKTNSA